MDIAAPEQDIVYRLSQRRVEAAGADLTITQHTDPHAAIQSADYVLTTFHEGGFESRHEDEAVPLKYGVVDLAVMDRHHAAVMARPTSPAG